jgi:putative FmdB family regulatory protein
MPTYEYSCVSCSFEFEKILRMSQYAEPQECPECGAGPAKKRVSLGAGFILSGDDWTGKNMTIARQMADKNKKLSVKENEFKREGPGMRLAPNVGGERVESWKDASKLAASKGKDTSGYDALARKETT